MTQLPQTQTQLMRRTGYITGVAAYLLWGVFPLYFHALKGYATPSEILAHRIIWSLPVVGGLLFLREALVNIRPILAEPKLMWRLLGSSVLIGVNWLLFVVAIDQERLLEASLGYFVNPLVNVALGMIFLRERLNRLQWVSLMLAGIGVSYLILQAESVPWLALGLAFSFGFYALLRKTVAVDSATGFFMETLILMPAALLYFGYLLYSHETQFFSAPSTAALLAVGGPLTALPLILYGTAVRLLPLSMMGFLQYLAPTLQFALAVFAFGEPFDRVRLTAFCFIWLAVAIFIADAVRRRR